jgi:hypothetical protein
MAALKYLNEKKIAHSKVSSINYDELKIQEYLTNSIFSDEEVNLSFALRSRYVECRANFKSKYREDDIQCQFGCRVVLSHKKTYQIKYDRRRHS